MTEKLPTFNLSRIEGLRDRLALQLSSWSAAGTVGEQEFDQLFRRLTQTLPSSVSQDALFESTRHLAGQPLPRAAAYRLAWRLAGNLPLLMAGQPVRPWTVQVADEWVPVTILRSFPAMNKKRMYGTDFTLLVLAGTPCTMHSYVFWTPRLVWFVARRVGFSRRGGKYVFRKPADLVGLRFLAKASAQYSRERPALRDIDCSPGLVSWNRKNVLRLRCRNGQQCPNGWLHPCHQCGIGYEQCNAGTHYRTYTTGECVRCGDAQAIFDPEILQPYCIPCAVKLAHGNTVSGG